MVIIFDSSDFKYHATFLCYSYDGNNWRHFIKIEVYNKNIFSLIVEYEYNKIGFWERKHIDEVSIGRFLDAVFTDDFITDLYFKTFEMFIPKMNENKNKQHVLVTLLNNLNMTKYFNLHSKN